MARPGDEFDDHQGGRIVFRETAVSSGGALLEVKVTYPPQSSLPPAHYHPSQEERFEVKAGIIRAIIEGQEKEF